MTVLARFSAPGGLPEPTDEAGAAWDARVRGTLEFYVDRFPQFYDPRATDTPEDAQTAPVAWSAFPASIRNRATTEEQRWRLADEFRRRQDEYCEWSVERDPESKITRVTFTCEVREYWDHVLEQDPDRLLGLYQQWVSPQVQLEDLLVQGKYAPANKWNDSTVGRLAHLVQATNNLAAAVDLAARATVLRKRNGEPVRDKQDLVDCANLGDPFRNSDPQIAAAINNIAATGAELTLQDPVGLYIHGILTGGMATPDGEDPVAFWTIERGDVEHTLRARYEVPQDRGYSVGDITIEGRPIRFGAQLADRVQVRITAVAKPGIHKPQRRPCED